jgi:hypothetical protein
MQQLERGISLALIALKQMVQYTYFIDTHLISAIRLRALPLETLMVIKVIVMIVEV